MNLQVGKCCGRTPGITRVEGVVSYRDELDLRHVVTAEGIDIEVECVVEYVATDVNGLDVYVGDKLYFAAKPWRYVPARPAYAEFIRNGTLVLEATP